MVANYIRIAIRHLQRRKGYALINIMGLAIGMACCLLIALYVVQERSYDRHHENADRVVRIALEATLGQTHVRSAMSAVPLADAMEREFPEVEHATRLWRDRSGEMTVYTDDQEFLEGGVVFADADVFSVFTFPFESGDPTTALTEPNTVLLTASTARKYFGASDPVGRVLHFREPSDRDVFTYTVIGVLEDLPATSHISFDFLASYVTQTWSRSDAWLGFGVYTYSLLDRPESAADVDRKLVALFEQHAAPQVLDQYGISYDAYTATGQGYRYFTQPLTGIHLDSALEDELQPNGNRLYVLVFSLVAFLILLIACINFTNLATAQSAERAKEVGVRKVLGARRSRLVAQFLTESVLLSAAALVVAGAMVWTMLPAFNSIAGLTLALDADAVPVAISLVALGLGVGLLAGSYPAFYLSRFQPAAVLKRARHAGGGTPTFRNVLVVFQFAISIVLIAGTAVVYRQMQFLHAKNLGFEPEQVIVLDGAEVMGPRAEAFRETVRGLPSVEFVTNAEKVPGRAFSAAMFHMEDDPENTATSLDYTYASFDFAETIGLRLVAGRALDRSRSGDSLAVILNETAVAHLGLTDPIGKRLVWGGESVYTIVGVVEDFHIASLHYAIRPVALLGPDPRNTNRPNLLVAVRVGTEDLGTTIADIETAWAGFAPRQPFRYSFLDQDFAALYRAERATGRLIATFALLALLIACIGLFGLASSAAERRTKEVGIRKVLGATVPQLVGLLSRDFVKLVAIAFAFAAPVIYFGTSNWLEGFAYRATLGVTPFLVGGLLTLAIALLTVGYHSSRTAMANPIHSLRYE